MRIDERYAAASASSNLRCHGDHAGDIDTILAAAASGQPIGATLSRCRNEFDDAHATSPRDMAHGMRRSQAVSRMASLSSGLALVVRMGVDRRNGRDLCITDAVVGRLAWKALSLWLDQGCDPCGALGFRGGYDGPRLRCAQCRGTGKRRGLVGKTDEEIDFVEALVRRIECHVNEFEISTRRQLRKSDA